MYDQRLFNQTGGLGSGFNKEDDEYDLFDKPLFADRTATSIYKNVKNINVESYTKKVLGSKQEKEEWGKTKEDDKDVNPIRKDKPVEFEKSLPSKINQFQGGIQPPRLPLN